MPESFVGKTKADLHRFLEWAEATGAEPEFGPVWSERDGWQVIYKCGDVAMIHDAKFARSWARGSKKLAVRALRKMSAAEKQKLGSVEAILDVFDRWDDAGKTALDLRRRGITPADLPTATVN